MKMLSRSFRRLRHAGCAVMVVIAGHGAAWGSEARTETAELSYTEFPFSFINLYLDSGEAGPFAVEPEVGKEARRGKLQFGSSATNAMAFIWDHRAGKLFLDLNRNLDLTDDAEGVFSSATGGRGSYHSFTNLHLGMVTSAGERRLTGDLGLWRHGNRFGGSFAVRSLWHGRVKLAGREWEVGLIEQEFGRRERGRELLLRPWSSQGERFSVDDGALQTVGFPKKLFLNGHAYAVALSEDGAGLRLQFTEENPALGELEIKGEFIHRLVLQGGDYTVVLDEPEASVRVPLGSYSEPAVCVRRGQAAAYRESSRGAAQRQVTVREGPATLLKAGGPLTNSVSIRRELGSLDLTYRLLGADGRFYSVINQDRTTPPRFAVYQGERRMGSGQFEFG
jgi:hypothetical protein